MLHEIKKKGRQPETATKQETEVPPRGIFLVATPSLNLTAHTIMSNAIKVKQQLKHVQALNENTPLTNTAAMLA